MAACAETAVSSTDSVTLGDKQARLAELHEKLHVYELRDHWLATCSDAAERFFSPVAHVELSMILCQLLDSRGRIQEYCISRAYT